MRLSYGLFVTAVAAQTVSQVLQDIQLITADTQNLTTQLQGPINADTVANVEIAALNLNSDTGKAAMDAKAVTGTVSEADQVSVLTAIENLYPDVIASLAAYVPVKAKLDQLIGAGTPESLLMSIQSSADGLASALIAKATGPYVAIGQTLQTDIDNAFKSALAGTVPTAVTLPTIPPPGGSSTTTSGSPVTTSTTGGAPPTTTTSGQPVYSSSSPSVYVTSTPPVYVSSSAPVYGSSSAPVYGSSSVPVYGSSSVPVYGSSSVPVYGSSSVPVYGSSSVPVYGSSSAPVYGSSSVPVYATTTAPLPSEGTSPAVSTPAAPQFPGAAGHAVANMGAVALAAGIAIVL